MYVCIYVCMYVFMYLCMYVRTYVCLFVCMFVCMCFCMCIYIYICICTYACMHVCMYMCVYVYICIVNVSTAFPTHVTSWQVTWRGATLNRSIHPIAISAWPKEEGGRGILRPKRNSSWHGNLGLGSPEIGVGIT